MVDELKGSLELKESLPYGAIREMAKTFGNADTWISKVISGKQKGNPLVLECAVKISDLGFDYKDKLTEILQGYGDSN
jgi:hypothetical protein